MKTMLNPGFLTFCLIFTIPVHLKAGSGTEKDLITAPTAVIVDNFGWDADCSAGAAGTIIGVTYGYRIPVEQPAPVIYLSPVEDQKRQLHTEFECQTRPSD